MATPMTAAQWRSQLRKFGQKYRELPTFRNPESGRSSETGKEFGPVRGGLIHHTAGPDDKPNNYDDVQDSRVVNQGRTGLPGPLAHAGATDDGIIELHTTDRANHAGDGDRDVYNAVVAEDYAAYPPRPDYDSVDGNDCFYGLEAYYTGTKPPKAAQYRAMVNWAAAFCDFHGWSAKSAIGHKEWTRRKIDPYGVDMARFRRDVDARIREVNAPAAPATITSDISVVLANVRSTPLMKPAQAQADYEIAFSAAAKANDQAVYINEFHTSYAAALDAVAKKYGYIVKKQGGLAVAYRRNRWALSGFAYSLITKGVAGITPNRGVLRLGNTTPAGTRVVFDCTMFPRGWMNPKYAEYATTHPLGVKLAKGIAAIVKSQTGTLKSAALVGADVNIGSLMNWTPYGVKPAASCMGTPDALDKMMQLHLFLPAGWTAKLVKVAMVPGNRNTDHGIVRAHFQVTRPR
ncbi:MAG TPA: peptidoglycan recognition family protein [Candidatus Limnocylindrales bacterium]